MEILRASGLGAEIDLGALPLLPGAERLATLGVRSSLYPANRANVPDLDPGEDARAHLLFDPQTAGGLLACVAVEDVGDLVAPNGPATRIGTITDGTQLRVTSA